MNLRLAVFDLAAAQRLAPPARARLLALAGAGAEPARLGPRLAQGLAVLGAALGGLGLVLWISANWASLGRVGQFALLQAVVVVMGLGAWWRPAARPALGLLTLLGIGALFGFFGQTYQTGADPWQLFAWWAALALPLALGVRSDVVWAPWVLVAMTGISLWTHSQLGHRGGWWPAAFDTTPVYLASWGLSLLVVLCLGPAFRGRTGAGLWTLRTAVTLTTVSITSAALMGLFGAGMEPLYGIGLLLVAGAAVLLSRPAHFDVFSLSAVALSLDALLVGGFTRLLFSAVRDDALLPLLLIGLGSAALLAATVQWVMRTWRRHTAALRSAA